MAGDAGNLLLVEELSVSYRVAARGLFRHDELRVLSGVGFSVDEGETLGVVGESGCGKTTLARAVLRLVKPSSGRILWCGKDTDKMGRAQLASMRRQFQIIFQDPFSSLNPRMRTDQIIGEPLAVFETGLSRQQRRERVLAMMERVGLSPGLFGRYPHELSGGQAQRVSIARALACSPRLIVCDEPVSALDVSVQAQILNLLAVLRRTENLALVFISHDLSVVRHISDRVLVLYLGRTVEMAGGRELFRRPLHPYTSALLAAAPVADPSARRRRAPALGGEPPSPLHPPSGCQFRTRCPHAEDVCARVPPPLEKAAGGTGAHLVACHRWKEIAAVQNGG